VLQLQERARLLAQEKTALQRRAEVAEAKVLDLQREAREHDAAAGQAQQRIAELQQRASEREAALQRQVDAAEERARGLALQLERAQEDSRALDVRPVAQALSGGVCTASHAELAAATRGFAAGSILGRGGFGPVYRGDLGGQAVAIKRLDQASPPRQHRCCQCIAPVRIQAIMRGAVLLHALSHGMIIRHGMTFACDRATGRPRSRASRSCCGR
jgi:hypothetical protein